MTIFEKPGTFALHIYIALSYDLMTENTHSQIGHYFFSYLLTCEVYRFEVLEKVLEHGSVIIQLLKPHPSSN